MKTQNEKKSETIQNPPSRFSLCGSDRGTEWKCHHEVDQILEIRESSNRPDTEARRPQTSGASAGKTGGLSGTGRRDPDRHAHSSGTEPLVGSRQARVAARAETFSEACRLLTGPGRRGALGGHVLTGRPLLAGPLLLGSPPAHPARWPLGRLDGCPRSCVV